MSRLNISRNLILSLVCSILLAIPASAQHFQQVKGTLVSVSAGRNEVFGSDTKGQVWRYNANTKAFGKVKGAFLGDIAVGGGTLSQLDEVWGISSTSAAIFHFNYSTKTFDQITGSLSQITVGVGNEDQCHPYEVWGINSDQNVFRYDYCAGQFEQIPGVLTQVATGGSDVWGLNNGVIFHYSFGQQQFGQLSGTLTQIAVGVNDVWGINIDQEVFRFDPNTNNWVLAGANVEQVAAGGDGAWLIAGSDDVYRFDSGSESFLELTGNLKSIAVGSGAGIFGVNSANQVFTWVRP